VGRRVYRFWVAEPTRFTINAASAAGVVPLALEDRVARTPPEDRRAILRQSFAHRNPFAFHARTFAR